MEIKFGIRNEETVVRYFERVQDPEIKSVLPQETRTAEDALNDYKKSLEPDATSYGRTILADGVHIGDVWCYRIDNNDEPNAMLSYCVFEKEYWNRGIATEAVRLFLKEVSARYGLRTMGAFTYADNIPSIRVLENNGFHMTEEFEEDGRLSMFFLNEDIHN